MTEILEKWHHMLFEKDFSMLDTLLADDVVFYSPVVFRPQHGKTITTQYLTAAYQVLFNETFHYVRQIVSEQDAVLEFEVMIDGILINGVDMIRWNRTQQITEFKVMVRPLQAMTMLHEKMTMILSKNLSKK